MKKDLIIAGILFVLLGAWFLSVDISTPEEYYSKNPAVLLEDAPKISLAIETPESVVGVILPVNDYAILEDETVFDLLKRVASFEKIPLDYSDFGGVYLRSIGGISEFDYGSGSGWIYLVNGEQPEISCEKYVLSENDFVKFVYVGDDKK